MPTKQMTDDEVIAAVKKHGSRLAAAKALGIPSSTFGERCQKVAGLPPSVRGGTHPKAPQESAPASATLLDAASVLKSFDTVGRAVELVRSVPAGQLQPDEAVRRELGVSYDRWRLVRGSARLVGYFIETPDKKWFWGRKDTIAATVAKLKELV